MKPISSVSQEPLERRIFLIRGMRVMLDSDLANIYGVSTKALNQAVKRNKDRFPVDFIFQLTAGERQEVVTNCDHLQGLKSTVPVAKVLRSQFVTSSWGGRRYLPYVFTELGVAMLSSVLNSDRAIEVNIQIMRVFAKLREMMATHKDLRLKIEELEKKYDYQFKSVFDCLRQMMAVPDQAGPYKRSKIGFIADKGGV